MPIKKSGNLKIIVDSEAYKEVEKLILQGISELLTTPKRNHFTRNYQKEPLTHNETLFLIETLYKELADPKLPPGLIFLYGRVLDYISSKTLYN